MQPALILLRFTDKLSYHFGYGLIAASSQFLEFIHFFQGQSNRKPLYGRFSSSIHVLPLGVQWVYTNTQYNPKMPEQPGNFDFERFRLGSLCQRGHEYSNTKQSLRRIQNNDCVECERLRNTSERAHIKYRKWIEKNKEYKAQKDAEYYQKNKVKKAAYDVEYYKLNGEKKRQRERQRNITDREKIRLRQSVYYQTKHGQLIRKIGSQRYKQRKRSNHKHNYTANELKLHLDKFNEECAYCGSKPAITIDHFIPVARGGSDCLGNFVLACFSCNSSKYASDPYEWVKRQDFYSDKRWKNILNILGKTMKNYKQIPLI